MSGGASTIGFAVFGDGDALSQMIVCQLSIEFVTLQQAMIDRFHMVSDDAGFWRNATNFRYVECRHGNRSAGLELGGSGIDGGELVRARDAGERLRLLDARGRDAHVVVVLQRGANQLLQAGIAEHTRPLRIA